jgi:glycosyltransferase involved in cell wall biosynthesis
MFSIVIPLYNKANYIERCLLSVFAQSYNYFEVIIINDGSSDDGPYKVTNFIQSLNAEQKSKIIFKQQKNLGVSTARNNGVKIAKRNYIAFLDADDWWEPTFLEEMKSLIDSFPAAGIYGSNYFLIKNKFKQIATVGVESNFSRGLINYCQVYAKTHCMPLWTGATIIRKAIYESENGFKSLLRLGEDFDLWVRVALKYPVCFLNKPLSNYNQDVDHPNRAIGKKYDIKTNYLWNLEYLSEQERTNIDLKNVLDYIRVTSVFNYYLDNNFRPEAMKILDKVDWSLQPKSVYRKFYKTPVWLVKYQNTILRIGSKLKHCLLMIFR